MTIKKLSDIDIQSKRVMIREDFNVPIKDGVITNDARIQAALPTIQYALEQQAKIILLSHLGRPQEGDDDEKYSLAPIALRLTELLQQPVLLKKDWLSGIEFNDHNIVLCENVRFNVGEKADNESLAKKMAQLCDVFVMDAFATAHRTQASTHGVAKYAPLACAGPLLIQELNTLSQALENPKKPIIAIVGGSKVSTKLQLLQSLIKQVDCLIVGGGIANTFLAAAGFNIGKSLHEPELIPMAKELLEYAEKNTITLPLPQDVTTATRCDNETTGQQKNINEVRDDEMILDIGPKTAEQFSQCLQTARTIIWNGPVGVFELEPFSQGTKTLAHAIANSSAYSLAGGGDTIAAIDQYQLHDKISYISTGGGAFLAYLQGESLPGIVVLER